MQGIFKMTTLPITMSVLIGLAAGQTPTTTRGGSAETQTRVQNAQAINDSLTQAIEMNSAELTLAKMATTKAQDAKVKSFAEMMVKDHTAALLKLNALRSDAPNPDNIKPNARDQATADKLSKLSGTEFDREYMTTMVADHQAALDFFEKQSKTTPTANNTLPNISQDMATTVRKHLTEAQDIQKGLGSTTSKPGTTNTNRN